MVQTKRFYLTWVWNGSGMWQTPRQNYHRALHALYF